jgi:hypothetical protein
MFHKPVGSLSFGFSLLGVIWPFGAAKEMTQDGIEIA